MITFGVWREIAVNRFHFLGSFDKKHSVERVSHLLQIFTRCWDAPDVNRFSSSL